MKEGYLLDPDTINLFDNVDKSIFLSKLNEKTKHKPLVINKDLYLVISELDNVLEINWNEFEKSLVDVEKGRGNEIYSSFLDIVMYNLSDEKREILNKMIEEVKEPEDVSSCIEEGGSADSNVIVLKSYDAEAKKRDVNDFVSYFKNRYESIKCILLSRRELQDAVSISRIKNKKEGEIVSVVGLVSDKRTTKNGHILLTIEDCTGSTLLLANKGRDIFNMASEIHLDEVIGISGVANGDIIYCNEIFLPEIPGNLPLKVCDDDVYMAVISDTHIGIKQFLHKEFENFIKWLNGEYGNKEQKEIVSKLKYLFIAGDLVEGVGIYPGQEEDLVVKDIFKQYELAYDFLSRIPKHIKIILCGGNHDAMRLSEPQPAFDKRMIGPLSGLDNLTLVSNPSYINIHSSNDFEGFDVLLYHGFSFPYYADSVDKIRQAGGLDKVDMIMEYLLRRRHLAPCHTSSMYIPDSDKDFLVIDKVPDFFISGHIHKVTVTNYKHVGCINASCWDSQTEDQERRGIVPDPARVVLVNLKDRGAKIMNFKNEK